MQSHTSRDQSDRLRKAPTTSEIGLAVALFGTAVLVGSGFADFHTLRHASSDGGGGGSDGGGDGGGCGGGVAAAAAARRPLRTRRRPAGP